MKKVFLVLLVLLFFSGLFSCKENSVKPVEYKFSITISTSKTCEDSWVDINGGSYYHLKGTSKTYKGLEGSNYVQFRGDSPNTFYLTEKNKSWSYYKNCTN